jgi:hypothetical protein
MNNEENRLMTAFKQLSAANKAEVISHALLVERIEDGVRRQYGLGKEPPKDAA